MNQDNAGCCDSRPLTPAEIRILEQRNCICRDWSRLRVAAGFEPQRCRNVMFSGDIYLGNFREEIDRPGGFSHPTGIYDAILHDVTVGDEVLIRGVSNLIARMDIEAHAVIEDVGLISVDGLANFGNGAGVNVMIEAGGRQIPLYERLSSQAAFLAGLFRDRHLFSEKIRAFLERAAEQKRSTRGRIGREARIRGCQTLRNVWVGPGARIYDATFLEDGTINSSIAYPTRIAEGVVAKKFIFSTAAVVDGGARLETCFVGQGTRIGRQYAAEHSLFFANSELFLGEACSVLAGPFTASHHKGTLLIAGCYSFYNAGSSTNFSNHNYKLGPLHQGMLDRGCKTGSSSYMYWPTHVGAFTVVTGQHRERADISMFPFSLYLVDQGRSLLVPGANLFTVGTRRDGDKWLTRDRRPAVDRLDRIDAEVFTPYTVARMRNAAQALSKYAGSSSSRLGAATNPLIDMIDYDLPKSRIEKAIADYNLAIDIYLERIILDFVEERLDQPDQNAAQLLQTARNACPNCEDTTEWLDLGGMLIPQPELDRLIREVEEDKITDITGLEQELERIHAQRRAWEQSWALSLWAQKIGGQCRHFEFDDLYRAVSGTGKEKVIQYRIHRDAEKEFDRTADIGFGFHGGYEAARADFEATRGYLEENNFVKQLDESTQAEEQRRQNIAARMANLN